MVDGHAEFWLVFFYGYRITMEVIWKYSVPVINEFFSASKPSFSVLLCDTGVGISTDFSFASWHHIKLCQLLVSEDRLYQRKRLLLIWLLPLFLSKAQLLEVMGKRNQGTNPLPVC